MDLHNINHSAYTRARSEACTGLINWYEYSRDAFEKARNENKPIFLLISAPAWCHWCHVYESEDFLFAPEVYKYINEHYIPIFVDADKRPDITRNRLEGGWPSTVLLTSEGVRAYGFSGPQEPRILLKLLEQVKEASEKREITAVEKKSENNEAMRKMCSAHLPSRHSLEDIVIKYVDLCRLHADPIDGGFGLEAKFPQAYTLSFLHDYALRTADAQINGLIERETDHHYTPKTLLPYRLFDPVDGGFHRYCLNRDWTSPHYEKMLSENARLLKFYATYGEDTNDSTHKEMANKTFQYVLENLYDDEFGGFYNSQDADLEEHYYGLSMDKRAALPTPHIEQTKYMPANAEMVVTFLELAQKDWRGAKTAALKTLDLITKNVDRHNGASHILAHSDKAETRNSNEPKIINTDIAGSHKSAYLGELGDTAFAGLALLHGHLFFQKEHPKKFLDAFVNVCDFLVEKLYDKCDGGFLARFIDEDSPINSLIANDEERPTQKKPLLENGVASYILLCAAEIFHEEEYRRAALTTLNHFSGILVGLDEQYYFARAAQLALVQS